MQRHQLSNPSDPTFVVSTAAPSQSVIRSPFGAMEKHSRVQRGRNMLLKHVYDLPVENPLRFSYFAPESSASRSPCVRLEQSQGWIRLARV